MVRWLSVASGFAPLCLVACVSGTDPTAGASPAPGPAPSVHGRAVRTTAPHGPAVLGAALPDDAGAHLAISLRTQNENALTDLLRDQQDPASPRFHAWITPEQFGDRFGLPEATYARVVTWVADQGFQVTRYPNRLFVEAVGTVGQVRELLGVQLRIATQKGRTFRSHAEDAVLPDDIASLVLKIGGLDTRTHLRHRMNVNFYGAPTFALDAKDLRTLYDIPGTAPGASGLTLAVLGTQEGTVAPDAGYYGTATAPWVKPNAQAIQTYLTSLSGATATYNPIQLPNPGNDFDGLGSNSEFQLDVEMQSVGAPNAKDLDLVLSPASVVFQTGAQYIVNTLSTAVAVSTSLGDCESDEVSGAPATDPTSDAYIMQQAVKQGLTEGQTWFGPSGDEGAADCDDSSDGTKNGYNGGNATVDFPCSLPEVVCVGGTMFEGAGAWDANGDLTGYVQEEVCNEGDAGVAGGGGQSMLYTKPSWQQGVGPEATDGRRDVPDFSLMAATATPGIVDYDCGQAGTQDACGDAGTGMPGLDIAGGTSFSSPLAAGIFAHLSGDVGCRLGDIHATIYALGAAQQKGGAAPFHDITVGTTSFVDTKGKVISGFSAGPGYDLASGWGSLDVAKLIAAWPACGTVDAGVSPGMGGNDAGTTGTDAGKAGADAGGSKGPHGSGSADASGGAHSGGKTTTEDGGSHTTSGSTGGCSVTVGGAAGSTGWLGSLMALGLVTLRRRRRTS